MDDKNIDQLQYVDVTVTPESMEVHLHVLKENGYAIQKRAYMFATCLMCFLRHVSHGLVILMVKSNMSYAWQFECVLRMERN